MTEETNRRIEAASERRKEVLLAWDALRAPLEAQLKALDVIWQARREVACAELDRLKAAEILRLTKLRELLGGH